MTLYYFSIDRTAINEPFKLFVKKEDGFEEKVKVFQRKTGYPRMIRKDQIGTVSNNFCENTSVWLTENDKTRAKELFRLYFEDRLSKKQKEYERVCENYRQMIAAVSE